MLSYFWLVDFTEADFKRQDYHADKEFSWKSIISFD